jgi:hypothetical protein
MAVGTVWIVGIVCLVVGALLNAPGIRKTALGQEVGLKRDIAQSLADPLYDLSHALFLDRPREGLQEVIGRSEQDDIDLTLPSPRRGPTATTVPGPTATTIPGATIVVPAPRRAFAPTNPMRLWVGGDSLAITPGESIINLALTTQVVSIIGSVDGHVSTGLARPEVFNWAAYLNDVLNAHNPDLVVLTIGSNDDQALTGENAVSAFGSEAWKTEYRRRVGGLMDLVTATGNRQLLWIGIPPMRNTARYVDHYLLINDLVRSEAKKRAGKVTFVDTSVILGDGGGGYTDYLTNPDGSALLVRAPDGTHFTRAGGDRIAGTVLLVMDVIFDLNAWRKEASTSTTPPPTTTPTTTIVSRPGPL